jgi:transposase
MANGVVLEHIFAAIWAVPEVVSEAGPTGFSLARRLQAEGFECQVIAPSKLLAPVGPEAKSDRLDCRLAQLAAKGLLHPVRVPTEQEAACTRLDRLPSEETSRQALYACLPEFAELQRHLNRALAGRLPRALRRRRQRLAIDGMVTSLLRHGPDHVLPFDHTTSTAPARE